MYRLFYLSQCNYRCPFISRTTFGGHFFPRSTTNPARNNSNGINTAAGEYTRPKREYVPIYTIQHYIIWFYIRSKFKFIRFHFIRPMSLCRMTSTDNRSAVQTPGPVPRPTGRPQLM